MSTELCATRARRVASWAGSAAGRRMLLLRSVRYRKELSAVEPCDRAGAAAMVASTPAMPVDPARLNAVGDLVLSDAHTMRALADPLRLTLFDLVRREGPVASKTLAQRTGQDQATVDDHLRELESLGFVEETASEDGEVRWTTNAKGIYFEIPEEPAGQLAARQLSKVMLAKYAELPVSWVRSEEPRLDLEWVRAAGLFNARVELTPDELRGIQEGLERLLEGFTARSPADTPAHAASVRILCFFMPETGRDP
jgi:DNA-binding MarR family transcriptional regulator